MVTNSWGYLRGFSGDGNYLGGNVSLRRIEMKKACSHEKLLPIYVLGTRVLTGFKCQLCQKKLSLKEARPIFDKVFNKLNKGV